MHVAAISLPGCGTIVIMASSSACPTYVPEFSLKLSYILPPWM